MRKILVLLLAALLAFGSFTACANNQEGDQLSAIKKAGKIKIALEGAWAPWGYHDLETNELIGFDVEVGKLIAEELGVAADFQEGEWDSLFAGLETGRYDLVINGVDVTEDRQKKYDFSEAYTFQKTVVIVRSDYDEITKMEDLAGKKTCNSINSTYMLDAEAFGATVTGVDSLEETLNMVLAGRVDATLNAEGSFDDYMKVHPEAGLKVACAKDEVTYVAIPMRKEGNTELKKAIDAAILKLHESGKLSELSIKYFGKDYTRK